MWKKVNPGMEYVIAAMRRIAAEKGKRMSCYYDNGTGWCDGQRKARGGYFRICWGCPKLASKKKEEKSVKDRAKNNLLKNWDAIVSRIKQSGYDLSRIHLTIKEEE